MDALSRHQNIALQLSGGKDSVACLYFMRPHLDRITVYHLNTGDQPPETAEVIAQCRKIIPHYVEIQTNSREWIAANGYPSDVVPTFSSPLGLRMGFGTLPLIDRFTCCWQNLMLPMHQRMQADGMTLLIRGQKLVDMPNVPFRSGHIEGNFELLYPLEDWTDSNVMSYLKGVGAPIHPVYEVLRGGIDCMHCTGWWDEHHLKWLDKTHPEPAEFVRRKHIEIKAAVAAQLAPLEA